MSVAPSRRPIEREAIAAPSDRLARLRAESVAALPIESRPRRAPSPLGGVRRNVIRELPRWGDSSPAQPHIEPLRLAVIGALALMALILVFGVTQRLAQSHSAPPRAIAAQPALPSAQPTTPPAPSAAPANAPVAIMPPPDAASTPSAQITALKQALGDGATAAATAAPTVSAPVAAVLSSSSAPPAAPAPTAQPANGWGATGAQQAQSNAGPADPSFVDVQGSTTGPIVGSAPQPGAAIVWPVTGPLTSCFCPYHPLGIDIGVPLNTPVRAMAAGKIAFVGGNACCSYGYYVDIDHGNGIMTRYGHLSYIPAIPIGTAVRPGDIIGMSGTTGYSTGPHLHFEVRLNGVPVNPLDVLP